MAVSFEFKHEKETITIVLDLTKTKDKKAKGKITKKRKKPEQNKPDVFPFEGEVEIQIGTKEKDPKVVSTVRETAGNKNALITITCVYDKDNKNTKGVIQTGGALDGGTYDVTAEEQDKAIAALKGVLT